MADYIWPWPKGTIASQEFGANPNLNGDPLNPNPRGGHTGIDGALEAGTPLRAPCDGVVTFEGWAVWGNNPYYLTDGGGICLAIDAGDGRPAFIAGHLSATFVNVGDPVKQGDVVAESGNTGRWTTGPHCHFEAMPPVFNLNSDTYGRVNPRDYCTAYWEDVNAPVGPNQRETLTKVWQRTQPDHRYDELRVKLWDENLVFTFRAWTKGTDPFGDGNTTWFVGAYTDTYFHSSAFKDMGTHDLPEMTQVTPPPPPPPPDPWPVPTWAHLNGIDVSNHNEGADLSKLPADFCIIKASEGVGWVDPALASNVAEARAKGMVVLFYHYARPLAQDGNTSAAEAVWFMECVKPYIQPGDGAVLDWEAENTDRGDWAKDWLDRTAAGLCCTPLFYSFLSLIRGLSGPDWQAVAAKYPLWLASYGANAAGGFRPALLPEGTIDWPKGVPIWQYTSKGRLPGYEGDLDLNVFYGTRADLLALGTKVIEPPPPPPPPGDLLPPGPQETIEKLVDYYVPLIDRLSK